MVNTARAWFGAATLAAGLSLTGAAVASADSTDEGPASTPSAAKSVSRTPAGPAARTAASPAARTRSAQARVAHPAAVPRAARSAQTRPAADRSVTAVASTAAPTVTLAQAAKPVTSANVDLENWMAKLPGVDQLPLTALPIPGTHDSGSGSISATAAWASTGLNDFGVLTKLPSWLVKPIVLKWARTQSKDLAGQFADGIRYVDLRLSYEPDGQIYLEHGLRGASVDEAISQIADFATTHPKEVLLVNMGRLTTGVPTSDWTPEMHDVLVSKLEQNLGARMAPASLGSSATLQDFWAIDKNIVLMYPNSTVTDAHPDMWLSWNLLYQPWPNVQSVPKLLQANTTYLANRPPDKIWGLSGQTTPDTVDIVRSLLLAGPDSIQSLMKTEHPALQNWMRYNFRGSVNLVTTDFYDATWARGSYVRDVLAGVDGAYIAPRLNRFTKLNIRN